MNAKKFTFATIAVFVFIVVFGILFHGFYMRNLYEQTASLWRTQEAMEAYQYWIYLGQFIFAIGFVALFTKAFKRGGLAEGIVYGLLLAVIFIGNLLIWYAVAPYSASLLINWIVGTVIELILAGIIVAFIYRSKATNTA